MNTPGARLKRLSVGRCLGQLHCGILDSVLIASVLVRRAPAKGWIALVAKRSTLAAVTYVSPLANDLVKVTRTLQKH